MDKKIAGLLGAVSGLALTAGQTAAAPVPDISNIQSPRSYSELLEPIPNASALLRVADAAEAAAKGASPSDNGRDPNVKLVYDHHHHHHHHHNYHHHHHHHYPPWWYYHHHHHHHYYDHHHHHHNRHHHDHDGY